MNKPILRIKDDGTLLVQGWRLELPAYWKATEARGVYQCSLTACKYRRFSYRVEHKKLAVQLHCFLKKADCSAEDCQACALATPDTSEKRKVAVRNADGITAAPRLMRVTEKPDLLLLGPPPPHWLIKQESGTDTATTLAPTPQPKSASQTEQIRPAPVAYTAGQPRPDLAAIQLTLPAPDAKERTFARPIFEPDGEIVYPKREGDWELPQNINGYVRDPNNAWRFLPLWLPCTLRYQMAFLKANCGCIDIIMRCNNPQAPAYSHRLDDTACKQCPHRR